MGESGYLILNFQIKFPWKFKWAFPDIYKYPETPILYFHGNLEGRKRIFNFTSYCIPSSLVDWLGGFIIWHIGVCNFSFTDSLCEVHAYYWVTHQKYELLSHFFKKMNSRYDNHSSFFISQHFRITHCKMSNYPISEKNLGFEGVWVISWCNMWWMLWPDQPGVSYTTHMLHQLMTPHFYY